VKGGSTKVHSFRLLWLVMVGAVVLTTSSCELLYQLLNQPPEAGFTVGPSTAGAAPFAITVTSSSSDPDDNIESYAWQFGDGGVGAGPSAPYTYATPGTWTIVLTVTDKYGKKDIATKTVIVTEAQVGPKASFTATPTSGTVPLYVSFNAGASTYDDGAIQSYTWDFGDGATSYGLTTSHTYYTAGTRTVTLTVRATDGETGTATKTITASTSSGGGTTTSGAPSARFTVAPTSGVAPLQVRFDPATSEADEGRVLILYTWSFGDGDALSTIGPDVQTHPYVTNTSSEVFSARLLVLDNEGDDDSITKTVKAYNFRPIAGFEIANPDGGDTAADDDEIYTTAIAAWNAWELGDCTFEDDDVVYGDLQKLGPMPISVWVVIRSKEIPDVRWFNLDGSKEQTDLRTSRTSAVSSTTPAAPTGYADHNFSYDPEGQTWAGDTPPYWFDNASWGIRYLYIDWGDGTATQQVAYAETDWTPDFDTDLVEIVHGDVVGAHEYKNINADGTVRTITVTAEDWLGYRSASFSRNVTLKQAVEVAGEL